MPSTYSDLLRLELMADGENNSTWGSKTNTNLDIVLESAIAGQGSIILSSDADYTLTTANASIDEARNAILKITSSVPLTATRNIIIPTSSKIYVVNNGTTGGRNLVIKTASGTGITIPNGSRGLVYCDGVNVLDISGTLALSNTAVVLTNNTAIGIDSFSNTSFRSAEYLIQLSQLSNYVSTKLLVIHDGNTAYTTEYGKIYTGSDIGQLDINKNGSNFELQLSNYGDATVNNITIKLIRNSISV